MSIVADMNSLIHTLLVALSLSHFTFGFQKLLHDSNSADALGIQNTLALYPIYLDSKNFGGFTSIFTPNVSADYSTSIGVLNGIPEIQSTLSAALANVTTQHSLTTQYFEVIGAGQANTTSYFVAAHFGMGVYEGQFATAYGKYEDTLKLTSDGTWKIDKRRVVYMVGIWNLDSVASGI